MTPQELVEKLMVTPDLEKAEKIWKTFIQDLSPEEKTSFQKEIDQLYQWALSVWTPESEP